MSASLADSPIQPDHFYPTTWNSHARSPSPSEGGILSPDQDPLATRGIPVFRPTMEEFADFEAYMNRVEIWGRKSGIVKIIPPKEWSDTLQSTVPLLPSFRLKKPIEQHMFGRAGLFRQQNIEKRKVYSVREWAELCAKKELRSPQLRSEDERGRASRRRQPRSPVVAPPTPQTDEEVTESVHTNDPSTPTAAEHHPIAEANDVTYGSLEDQEFYTKLDPRTAWLPADTKPEDYTPEACRDLERTYWRTCGFGKPPMYGADLEGSLFSSDMKTWNVACLPSLFDRLNLKHALPGVNTPYLYFGMWRATFAWHVEDMDLYSINYIHWGAPKFWYAMPSERSVAFEGVMQGYFPRDVTNCPQFLRHKSFLASPTLLTESSCRPNTLVQHQGEFVVTFPRGYHAGFNLGFNCAESVNFALDNWIDLARKAGVCKCVGDSVRIDIDALLHESSEASKSGISVCESDAQDQTALVSPEVLVPTTSRKKRKPTSHYLELLDAAPQTKRSKNAVVSTKTPSTLEPKHPPVTLKIPRPAKDRTSLPCCLCPSSSVTGLLRLQDLPPASVLQMMKTLKPMIPACTDSGNITNEEVWMAHEHCARAIPETWLDEIAGHKRIFGVDTIVKDRWNLKCTLCTRPLQKLHGAKVQCTRGKCPKAFHVTCAIESSDVLYRELGEVEKDLIVINNATDPTVSHLDPIGLSSRNGQPTAIKTIKKPSIEVLCAQHNPVLAEQRRNERLNNVRAAVLALLPMSRIRVRVPIGVFEVTYVSANVEEGIVNVIWDDGHLRDFRWGSIVWSNNNCSLQPSYHPPSSQIVTQNVTARSSYQSTLNAAYPSHHPSGSVSTPLSLSAPNPQNNNRLNTRLQPQIPAPNRDSDNRNDLAQPPLPSFQLPESSTTPPGISPMFWPFSQLPRQYLHSSAQPLISTPHPALSSLSEAGAMQHPNTARAHTSVVSAPRTTNTS